jgi:hypothetical protein
MKIKSLFVSGAVIVGLVMVLIVAVFAYMTISVRGKFNEMVQRDVVVYGTAGPWSTG